MAVTAFETLTGLRTAARPRQHDDGKRHGHRRRQAEALGKVLADGHAQPYRPAVHNVTASSTQAVKGSSGTRTKPQAV